MKSALDKFIAWRTRLHAASHSKPPMNVKREVARRLRQMERGDALNHPRAQPSVRAALPQQSTAGAGMSDSLTLSLAPEGKARYEELKRLEAIEAELHLPPVPEIYGGRLPLPVQEWLEEAMATQREVKALLATITEKP